MGPTLPSYIRFCSFDELGWIFGAQANNCFTPKLESLRLAAEVDAALEWQVFDGVAYAAANVLPGYAPDGAFAMTVPSFMNIRELTVY